MGLDEKLILPKKSQRKHLCKSEGIYAPIDNRESLAQGMKRLSASSPAKVYDDR